jgi:hypothetical protein
MKLRLFTSPNTRNILRVVANTADSANPVASVHSQDEREEIVKRVNMHDDLIKALQPFARLAHECLHNSNLSKQQDVYAYNHAKITMDDLRLVEKLL